MFLHFWSPLDDNCLIELNRLKVVRDRFEKDGRLAMIGLCVGTDSKIVAKVIKEKELSWPQAILRDRAADSIVLEYSVDEFPKTLLIGPDGKVVAKDLATDKVGAAVAKALARQ